MPRLGAVSLLMLAVCVAVSPLQAIPLSISIDDHDFTFDVPLDATYDYAGADRDKLSVSVDNGHFVHGYTYTGLLAAPVPIPASPAPYPVYSGMQFAGNLDLEMYFDLNDGPYVSSTALDGFGVSLVGTAHDLLPAGHLTITGWLATQGFPPAVLLDSGVPAAPDIVLLDIEFSAVTLLARGSSDTADLIEGIGKVNMLLGEDVSQNPEYQGSTFLKFMAPAGTSLFGAPFGPLGPRAEYDPLVDYGFNPVTGRISGEAGVIPEPATLLLLAVGSVFLRKRR